MIRTQLLSHGLTHTLLERLAVMEAHAVSMEVTLQAIQAIGAAFLGAKELTAKTMV